MRSCPSEDEMLDGHPAAGQVVYDDRAADPGGAPVDEDERDALIGEVPEMAVLERCVGDDQAVDPAVPHQAVVDVLGDTGAVGRQRLRLHHEDETAGLRRGLLDAVGDVREPDVVEARDDQPDRAGPPRPQAASERVGSIAQLLGGIEDPLAGLGPHLLGRVATQDARRRRGIDLGATCDVRSFAIAGSSWSVSTRRRGLPGLQRPADDTALAETFEILHAPSELVDEDGMVVLPEVAAQVADATGRRRQARIAFWTRALPSLGSSTVVIVSRAWYCGSSKMSAIE